LKHGKVIRGQLGVMIKDLSPDLAETLGLPPGSRGVLVMEVMPGTPAEKAGLKTDDVIVKFNGKNTESASQLRILVSTSEVGRESSLEIVRGKNRMTIPVKVAELKSEQAKVRDAEDPHDNVRVGAMLGM